MKKRRISKARQVNAQQAQINRINKLIQGLQRQGFQFQQNFLRSLHVSGSGVSASAAKKRAEKLRNITKSKLYDRVKSYTTDDGTVISGKDAGRRGRLLERRKNRKKKDNSFIENGEDALLATVDALHVKGRGWVDKSDDKDELMFAWYNFAAGVKLGEINVDDGFNITAKVINLAAEIQYPSDSEAHYDSVHQKIINIMTGGPVPVDQIGNDEDLE